LLLINFQLGILFDLQITKMAEDEREIKPFKFCQLLASNNGLFIFPSSRAICF